MFHTIRSYRYLFAMFIMLALWGSPLKADEIPLAPKPIDAIDENGLLINSPVENVDGELIIRNRDLRLATLGQYSDLSLLRTMRYIQSSFSQTSFARHGFHNFDIAFECGGCSAENGMIESAVLVGNINVFGIRYHFSASFTSTNRIYDVGGSGNIIERYQIGNTTEYRFIRSDGLVVEFFPDNNPSIFGPRVYFAKHVKFSNGEFYKLEYDDLNTIYGNPQYRKRLRSVEDYFGRKLLFSYLRSSPTPDPQDIDASNTISSIKNIFPDGSELRADYQYESFSPEQNSTGRYIPRALSSLTLNSANDNYQVESYVNQYLGSVLFISTTLYPMSVRNNSGKSEVNYAVTPLNAGRHQIDVTPLGGERTRYVYELACIPNSVIPCPEQLHLTRSLGESSSQYYVKDFPESATSLSHPWSQQVICNADEAGNSYCPVNRMVHRVVLGNGRATNFGYDRLGRLNRETLYEGNFTTYDYNERGSVISKKNFSKGGSEIIEEIAGYSPDCSNIRTCNKPLYLIDARGNRTDFQYDPVHGGITRKTLPAGVNGVRPETRYTYQQHYAWLKSGGAWIQAATPIWLRSSEEFCRTSSTDSSGNCAAGPSDKVVMTYEYEQGNPTKGSSLLLKGQSVTADGQTQRTCYAYDGWGRRISETAPRAGLAVCP